MLSTLQRTGIAAVAGLYVLFFAGYAGIWFTTGRCDRCFTNLFSNNFLTVLALTGGIFGLDRAKGADSGPWRCPALVVTLLSAGLVMWSFGSAIWTYYNFRYGRLTPYPSWADAGYFPQLVLTFIAILACFAMTNKPMLDELLKPKAYLTAAGGGLYMLFRAVRAKQTFESDGDVLKFIFDVAYPLGATINAVLLIVFLFGTALLVFTHTRKPLAASIRFLLAGTIFLGLGDLFFNIGTSVPKDSMFAYTNGNWTDAVYLSGLCGLSIGALWFPLETPGASVAG
jgi:hypothetical protein